MVYIRFTLGRGKDFSFCLKRDREKSISPVGMVNRRTFQIYEYLYRFFTLSGKQRKVNVLSRRYTVQTIVISLKNPAENLQASELHRRTLETTVIIMFFYRVVFEVCQLCYDHRHLSRKCIVGAIAEFLTSRSLPRPLFLSKFIFIVTKCRCYCLVSSEILFPAF